MCLNIYFIPYLSVPLTDALYSIMVIFWMAAIINIHQRLFEKNFDQAYIAILIALFVSGVALVIRPAGIWLSFATAIMLFYYLCQAVRKEKGWTAKSPFSLFLLILVAGIAYLLPLLPQICINLLYFGKLSAFPNADLGETQLLSGIRFLKYGTNVSGGLAQMHYLNPFFHEATQGVLGLGWYFRNPLDALTTLTLKFVGAFDFDYIVPFIHNLRPWYRWVTGFFSLSILYFGLWGVLSYTFTKTREALFFGPRLFPLLCLVGWGSILASMYELRFGLPMRHSFLYSLRKEFYACKK
jgi:hypothetical protein